MDRVQLGEMNINVFSNQTRTVKNSDINNNLFAVMKSICLVKSSISGKLVGNKVLQYESLYLGLVLEEILVGINIDHFWWVRQGVLRKGNYILTPWLPMSNTLNRLFIL